MSSSPLYWVRSPHFPNVVLVPQAGCVGCKFDASTPDCITQMPNGEELACSMHPCDKGIWVDEVDAAMRRMEE